MFIIIIQSDISLVCDIDSEHTMTIILLQDTIVVVLNTYQILYRQCCLTNSGDGSQ